MAGVSECKFFKTGSCTKGKACPFLHVKAINNNALPRGPCRYFNSAAGCAKGKDCAYVHAANPVPKRETKEHAPRDPLFAAFQKHVTTAKAAITFGDGTAERLIAAFKTNEMQPIKDYKCVESQAFERNMRVLAFDTFGMRTYCQEPTCREPNGCCPVCRQPAVNSHNVGKDMYVSLCGGNCWRFYFLNRPAVTRKITIMCKCQQARDAYDLAWGTRG
jgi:hypothetical protein